MSLPGRLAAALSAATLLAACGTATPAPTSPTSATSPARSAALAAAHPQVIQPVAGAAPSTGASARPAAPSQGSVSVDNSGATAQPVSDATIRQELAASGMTPSLTQATLTPAGLAVAPVDAPPAVQAVISAGNEIAHLPYVWGGGHMTYEDTGYDCSGSLSFVLGAGGLLNTTMTSGELESWGQPGPGKWITVFAAAGHTFMYVAGLRFDTVALAETGTRWSDRPADEPDRASFVVRHPPGL